MSSTGKRGYGELVSAILKVLTEYGPMTRTEVCQTLGEDRMKIAAVFTRLNRTGDETGKRIYVVGYTDETEGSRRYPRAIYSIGDKPDAKKPKVDRSVVARRYRENLKKRRLNSVFALGMTRRQHEARERGL